MIIFCRRIPSLLMTVCHPHKINWSWFDFFYIFVYPKSRTRWREYTVIVSSTGLRLKTTCSALQVGLGGNSLGVILDESLSIINNQYMGGMVPCFLTSDNVRWDINWYPTGRCCPLCECPQILTDSVCFLNLS